MPTLKARRAKPRVKPQSRGLSLEDALLRVDSRVAKLLSVFYAELARAQQAGDKQGVQDLHRAIADAMRGEPDGDIDMPLMEALRQRDAAKRKKRRRASRTKST